MHNNTAGKRPNSRMNKAVKHTHKSRRNREVPRLTVRKAVEKVRVAQSTLQVALHPQVRLRNTTEKPEIKRALTGS